jgi:hypothetical protein
MYSLDNEQQGMLDWFDDRFAERLPVHQVRNRVAIKCAFNEGVTTFEYGEECDQEDVLLELAGDLIAQESDDREERSAGVDEALMDRSKTSSESESDERSDRKSRIRNLRYLLASGNR